VFAEHSADAEVRDIAMRRGGPRYHLPSLWRPSDPLASPLYADLTGLSPVYIQAGGDETLLDDARRLDSRATKAGVDARLDVFPGMLHTFQMAAGRAPEADDAIRRMAGWVRPKLGL
jgi:acetyl esterase/lipase